MPLIDLVPLLAYILQLLQIIAKLAVNFRLLVLKQCHRQAGLLPNLPIRILLYAVRHFELVVYALPLIERHFKITCYFFWCIQALVHLQLWQRLALLLPKVL